MRILLFTSQYVNALNYARAFASLPHDFMILSLIPSHKKREYEVIFSQFDHIRSHNVEFSPIYLRAGDEKFRNFLNPTVFLHDAISTISTVWKFRPDAAIGMYVIHSYPLVFLKLLLNFSLFAIVSGGDLELHSGFFWRIVRRFVFLNSEVIFTVGQKLRSEIKKETGYDALWFPTGAATDYFRPIRNDLRRKYGYTSDDIIILTLSLLLPRKRIDDVLKTFRLLKDKRNHNLKMIIAGEGPEQSKLRGLCSMLGLDQDVSFAGFVSKQAKLELFNIADIYVIASEQEGLPFSLMEAMSCGCICACSNVGDIPRVIDDGIDGFLVAPRKPRYLAKKLHHIMNLPESELVLIRSRARRKIIKNFDFISSTRKMVEIITERTAMRKAARGLPT